jgi:hypothetical protein
MKRKQDEPENESSSDNPIKISNLQDLFGLFKRIVGDFEKGGKGKLVKTVPAKKEWIEKRDAFLIRHAELKKQADRLNTERDIMWHEIELELDFYDNMDFSKDGKELNLYDSEV